ncbi:putative O-methyltransferase [Daldinia caldariorum]|uniref:putative O-methyltransferase n=1 Tax=Daldinia caldariorum TaxID=326644 RepID=UPI00200833D9|nr:putative O-methyltransferase [Daldinia caldariorum]KAI1473079.1 putative O-methyltransferase [Daldinia caldariorum]
MSSIEDLASSITEQVSRLSSLLQEAGLPSPTLDESGSSDFTHETDTPAGRSLREARHRIMDSAKDLVRLVQGPTEHLLTLTWAYADAVNINLIAELRIHEHVPLGSSISIQELAAAVRIPEQLLARIVRYGIANGVFVEERSNVIRHSASSALLVQNPHLPDIIRFAAGFLGNIVKKIPEAVLLKRDDPAHAPDSAFNLAYGTDESLFSYLHRNEAVTKEYHDYLTGRTHTPMWSIDRLRAAWPWGSLGKVKVVDVGGSNGHTVLALAPLMPDATFVVQDSNLGALEMGRRAVAEDSSLESRISFEEYNFFEPQPVQAEIYIFRHILHDWDDEDAVKILSSLLPALRPGAKVFISEGIPPEPPAKRLNTLPSKMARLEDVLMLGVHNSRERTVSEFESLLHRVTPGGFRLAGVTSGAEVGAFQSLLEFEFVGLAN